MNIHRNRALRRQARHVIGAAITALTVVDREEPVTVTARQPDGYFYAWIGDYDLDCVTGCGRTYEDAVLDLRDQVA